MNTESGDHLPEGVSMTTPGRNTTNVPKTATTPRGKDQAKTKKRLPPRKAAPAAPPPPHRLGWREGYGITRKTLARLTGLSERTLATWEGGGPINEAGQRLITGA